jgi:hypothetical protein
MENEKTGGGRGRSIAKVYHLVDEQNWSSVQAGGLMSAKRLAMASNYDLNDLRKHRARGVVLPSGARIRDQSPMPPAVLARFLRDGLSPEDWYDVLNSKVFFWLDPARLNRQRQACGHAPQRVLVIDGCRMLKAHGARACVAPINTGNAMRAAAPRGLTTFVPWEQWKADAWASEQVGQTKGRPATHRPVELTIEDEVADVLDYVDDVVRLGPGEVFSGNRPGQAQD